MEAAPSVVANRSNGSTLAAEVAQNATSMRSLATGCGEAPAEHGVGGAPWRQPVDLGADHAVEEVAGLAREIEHAADDVIRLQPRLDRGCRRRRPSSPPTAAGCGAS